MPFQSIPSLLAWQPPQIVQYIGGDILQEETKLCYFGAPKSFKSLYATQTAICIALGIPILGFPTKACKVCYLQAEVPQLAFRNRIYKMVLNGGLPQGKNTLANLVVSTNRSFKLDRANDLKQLEADLAKEKPKVLILDPWYKLLTVEDNAAYSRTQDIMDMLIDKHKLSIIMVHHDTVPQMDWTTGQQQTWFHPRGPRTVEGWFDSIIQVTGDVETDERRLKFETRNAQQLIRPMDIVLDRSKLWLEKKP